MALLAVDSSVLVAILNAEPEAPSLLKVLEQNERVIGWPTLFETRIWTIRHRPGEIQPWLDSLIGSDWTATIAFDGDLERIATEAFQNFGKGCHPAKLNFGDCMAYAVAKRRGVPLLFKGKDFGQTDVSVHPASVVTA